jgi:hypothetical protein
MAYVLQSGLHISLNNSTFFKLTDHNREEISIDPSLIENQSRMANGKLRKYVVAQKNVISTSWSFVPSKTSETVDGNYSAAWLESFYKANAGVPIYLKVISSELDPDPALGSVPSGTFADARTGSKTYSVFISNFSKSIQKRTKVSDYVDMSIEFTEI